MHDSGQTTDLADTLAPNEPAGAAPPRGSAAAAVLDADADRLSGSDGSAAAVERAEYRVIRHVATFALSESDPHAIAREAARSVAAELDAVSATIWRFDGDEALVAGEWGRPLRRRPAVSADALRSGRGPWWLTYSAPASDGSSTGPRRITGATAAAALTTPNGVWGAVSVSWQEPCTFDSAASHLLAGIAELVGALVINAVDLARLTGDVRDPLTGLPTETVFRERLTQEVVRSRRHSHPLTLAAVSVNGRLSWDGTSEHGDFDRVVQRVSRRLSRAARGGDVLGRLERDVFGWLLPYSDSEGAHVAADRLRGEISREALPEGVTVSIGICDFAHARDADALMAGAGSALDRAQARPGGATSEYIGVRSPEIPTGRGTGGPDRSEAIGNVYAMSRAVDARDPSMVEHSRRVADLAGHLARRLGWSTSREVRLREAALLHDVGKVGVPDEILLKATALTPDEYRIARTHAEIGAQIIAGVLDDEQVLWVRHHQERIDGRGYPDGLSGDLIPDGARILGVADSWDSMTAGRPYRNPLPPSDALAECTALAGTQFCPRVVLALVTLWESGAFIQGLGHLGAFE